MQIPVILLAFVIASCVAQKWTQMSGTATDISAKGKELWSINKDQQICRWNGRRWKCMNFKAVRVGASPDGWTWAVNERDEVFRYNVNKKKWEPILGSLVQISAMSKDKALGVNHSGKIFLWDKDAWIEMPGTAIWAGIGDGDERWKVSSDGGICRWNHQTNTWDQMPGSARNIDVQSPCRVIATNAENIMYIWKNNGWKKLPGNGKRSTINDEHYYCVNEADEIWIGN